MSGAIFKRLSDCAEAAGTPIADADQPRWIKRLSQEDADLMAKADIKATRKITRQMQAVQFEYEGKRCFVFFGFSTIEELPEGLTALPLTPGVFGIAVTETDVSPKATASQIRDIIEAPFAGAEGYDGHELDDVASLFPAALVLEADIDLTYTGDIDRVLGTMVAISYFDGPLSLSRQTLKAFVRVFEEGSEYIPYLNVLQGILSISWSGLYVELYRCIEQLYAVPRLLDLTQEWKFDRSLGELAELLEARLSWRPKEDDSLCKVIGACEDATVNSVIAAFRLAPDENSTRAEVAGRAIYAMRNGLVHFRGRTRIAPPTDEQWDEIVAAMLGAVSDSYDAFGRVFHGQDAPKAAGEPFGQHVMPDAPGAIGSVAAVEAPVDRRHEHFVVPGASAGATVEPDMEA